jgi:hypothetical protein
MINPKIIARVVEGSLPPDNPNVSPREVRLQGLALMIVGAVLVPALGFAALCLILLLGPLFGPGMSAFGVAISVVVGTAAIPLVVAYVGFLQLVVGVPFSRLESTFQEGGLRAFGTLILVVGSFVAFIVALLLLIAVCGHLASLW